MHPGRVGHQVSDSDQGAYRGPPTGAFVGSAVQMHLHDGVCTFGGEPDGLDPASTEPVHDPLPFLIDVGYDAALK